MASGPRGPAPVVEDDIALRVSWLQLRERRTRPRRASSATDATLCIMAVRPALVGRIAYDARRVAGLAARAHARRTAHRGHHTRGAGQQVIERILADGTALSVTYR